MIPAFWELLEGGVVVDLRTRGGGVIATVRVPHLADSLGCETVDVVLTGVRSFAYLPESDRWDEPTIEELPAIVDAAPGLDDATLEQGELRIWGPRGSLVLDYDEHALEVGGASLGEGELRAAVVGHWASWRAANGPGFTHPLVREALVGQWSRAVLPQLVEAWRAERTSELADVIDVLSLALEREPRALDTLESFAGWPAHYRRSPHAALSALVDAAVGTFDLLADNDPGRGPTLGAWLDARDTLRARWWRELAAAVATLRDQAPDPRIARTVTAMLRSPSDHWFRIDQVAHVAGPFEAPDDAPSFADHALALIEHHADAGTPSRLEERARLVGIECDCNGAEMRDALRELAVLLRARHPINRSLPPEARRALVHRAINGG